MENKFVNNGYDYYLGNNVCYQKARGIALEFIKYSKNLMEKKDFTIVSPLINQCVRSSTSVSANLSEGICPHISQKDRVNKFSISYKEVIETIHWLGILHDIEELPDDLYNHLLDDCTQVAKMLNSSINTLKKNINSKD